MSGETNWPRNIAAESNGITVVAAFLPPFIEAKVLRYGTPAPNAIYLHNPVMAGVLVLMIRQSDGKKKFVRMMKSAGRLTMSWTVRLLWPAKCSRMTPKAGAIAAPAITVRSEMERIVKVSLPVFF